MLDQREFLSQFYVNSDEKDAENLPIGSKLFHKSKNSISSPKTTDTELPFISFEKVQIRLTLDNVNNLKIPEGDWDLPEEEPLEKLLPVDLRMKKTGRIELPVGKKHKQVQSATHKIPKIIIEKAAMPEIMSEIAIAFRFIKRNWKMLLDTQVPRPIELYHFKPTKKTLILDLDETLIHTLSSFGELAKYKARSMKVEVVERGEVKRVYVALRPHLQHFLDALNSEYELIIFTSGEEQYANEVVNAIDPGCCYFSQVISRAGCLCVQGRYIKDLGLFSNRSLALDYYP